MPFRSMLSHVSPFATEAERAIRSLRINALAPRPF